MAHPWFRSLRRVSVSPLRHLSSSNPLTSRLIPLQPDPISTHSTQLLPSKQWVFPRNFSHGSVHLVISEGKPKFETREIDPPTKEKWVTKKRFKQKKKRDKDKRKSANKRDPRFIGVKGKKKKQKFDNAADRINDKLEKAKVKEAMLIERLKRYEVPKAQGPVVEPHDLTGEERFYLKKMAQKRSNYAPVGRRGIFGGVILNMHMHWKKHETVKVICKPCKPGQVQEYADEIARLSGGIPIQVIGDDTIIFYRGKNYVQPVVMSPIDTLSKKKALEKSKYEQSLESVRRFIAIAEKELELYYRHVALYGDPNNRGPNSILDSPRKLTREPKKVELEAEMSPDSFVDENPLEISEAEGDSTEEELSETEDDLELYYRHVALYGDPNNRGPNSILDSPRKLTREPKKVELEAEMSPDSFVDENPLEISEAEGDSTGEELSETEDDFEEEDPSVSEIKFDEDELSGDDLASGDWGEELF